jgi:hypothetical protein
MSHPDSTVQPPAALEERVVRALQAEGLIHSDRRKGADMKMLHARWAIAAGILLVAGLFAGSYAARSVPAEPDARPQFALLLYEDTGYRAAPPEGTQARIAEYAGWARKLASEDRLVDAGKLSDTGALLLAAGEVSSVVPRAEEGMLAGFFIIRAADRGEAERIAAECPHLKYGGTISLRDIEA